MTSPMTTGWYDYGQDPAAQQGLRAMGGGGPLMQTNVYNPQNPGGGPYDYSGGNPQEGMVYAQGGSGGGGGMTTGVYNPAYDQQQAADMFEQTGKFNQQELDQKYKLGKSDIEARMKIAGIESGDRRAGIEQQREAARATIEQARLEMEKIGIPRVEIERYIAQKNYEIAQSEMTLKRDVFVEETQQARQKIDLQRQEMERIGIPRVEIERFVAQENAKIAQQQYGLQEAGVTGMYGGQQTLAAQAEAARQREALAGITGYSGGLATLDRQKMMADQQAAMMAAGQSAREFATTASGYMQAAPVLTNQQQQRFEQIKARDDELRAAGQAGVSAQDRAELASYNDILAGRIANPMLPGGGPGGGGANTLSRDIYERDKEELARRFGLSVKEFEQTQLEQGRRYGLDVSEFGAQLASTPDTYFQARRFQGVDVPRLMGGAGAQTSGPTGGPTPGVATMGAYLSGQDPYGGTGGGTLADLGTNLQGPAADQRIAQGGYTLPPAGGTATYGGASVGAAPGAAPQAMAPGAGASGDELSQGWVPGAGADERQKQIAAIAKASPPSPYAGLNQQDASTLGLMQSIYQKGGQGIAGGELERLKASGRMGFLKSAGNLLGYDPSELESQYKAYRPTSGSAAAAG